MDSTIVCINIAPIWLRRIGPYIMFAEYGAVICIAVMVSILLSLFVVVHAALKTYVGITMAWNKVCHTFQWDASLRVLTLFAFAHTLQKNFAIKVKFWNWASADAHEHDFCGKAATGAGEIGQLVGIRCFRVVHW